MSDTKEDIRTVVCENCEIEVGRNMATVIDGDYYCDDCTNEVFTKGLEE